MNIFTEIQQEEGSALVDFIGFGVLLQIPVLLFSIQALSLQNQQFAIEAIARHAIRAHVLASDITNTQRVVSELAADFGLNKSDLSWNLVCTPDPSCLDTGSLIQFEIKIGGLSAQALQAI